MNCKELGEEPNQDEIEEQEDPQIENDVCKHDHDRSQGWEDSQEEECLCDQEDNNYAHQSSGN